MASDCEAMAKALYFENNSDEEYDLNLPPTSGHEYLRRVQLEARQCPNVVVANIDKTHFYDKQTVKYSPGNGCLPAPTGYTPALEWQKKQISDFSFVRLTVSKYKSRMKKREIENKSAINLPGLEDDLGWCCFCFGDKLKKGLQAINSESTNPSDFPKETCSGVPPLLSIVTSMSQPLIERVLDYHISWFEATGFTPEQGQWFYALLSNLEKPLTPEACSSIRTLARQCANLRACLENNEDQQLIHLNLLICLVSRYFDQGDLADT